MRRFACILGCFLAFSALCGCAVLKHGNDLAAFAARLRERDKSVDAAEGWFYDENERRLRRFFLFGEREVEVALVPDEKNNLAELWLVIPAELYDNRDALTFCKTCAAAFLDDEEQIRALAGTGFRETVTTPSPETKRADAAGAGFAADVTEAGSVVTFYREE